MEAIIEDGDDYVVRPAKSSQLAWWECPTTALFLVKKRQFNVMTVQYWMKKLELADKELRIRTLLGMATADQRQERARIFEQFKAARDTGS